MAAIENQHQAGNANLNFNFQITRPAEPNRPRTDSDYGRAKVFEEEAYSAHVASGGTRETLRLLGEAVRHRDTKDHQAHGAGAGAGAGNGTGNGNGDGNGAGAGAAVGVLQPEELQALRQLIAQLGPVAGQLAALPAQVAGLSAQVNQISNQLNTVSNQLDTVSNRLDQVSNRVNMISILAIQNNNSTRGDGADVPYMHVPNMNDTPVPAGLVPITTAAQLRSTTGARCRQWLTYYGRSNPAIGTKVARLRKLVAQELGLSTDIYARW